MTQPFFPCTISAQSRNNEFLTIKTVVRKTHQNNGHTGSSCLDKAVLAQRGGGVHPDHPDLCTSHPCNTEGLAVTKVAHIVASCCQTNLQPRPTAKQLQDCHTNLQAWLPTSLLWESLHVTRASTQIGRGNTLQY